MVNRRSRIMYFAAAIIMSVYLLAQSDDVKDMFKKGVEHTNKGEYDAAIEKFTKVITKDQDYANAYMALGIVYINKKMEINSQLIKIAE